MNIDFPLGKLSHIGIIDNFLSENFCSGLISFCSENYSRLFQPGEMMGGLSLEHKRSFDWPLLFGDPRLTPEEVDWVKKMDQYIYATLTDALTAYCTNYPAFNNWQNVNDTGYRVQHYPKNQGFYKSHVDGAAWHRDGAEKRVLAGIVYLNTIEDGGGTLFDAHGYAVDAVVGRLAIFPASWTHPHGGQVPISEDKWIISTFFC